MVNFLLLVFLSVSAQAFDPEVCNYDTAYESGFNDGQAAKKMDSSFLKGAEKI